MKFNIIRQLMRFDITLKVVPWNYDYTNEDYDGLFLSNGPGDPTKAADAISILKKALAKAEKQEVVTPIFGICLGNQLLSLAVGCRTIKLPYGNRGCNQPCIDCRTQK